MVPPSYPATYFKPTYFTFLSLANKFCHQSKLHESSKIHPQHGIKFCGGLLEMRGQVGAGWSILGGGSLSVITPSTRAHRASLGRRWTRIPWILLPVASLALSLVKPALNLFLTDQSLASYPFPFAVRHVKIFFTTIWNWKS